METSQDRGESSPEPDSFQPEGRGSNSSVLFASASGHHVQQRVNLDQRRVGTRVLLGLSRTVIIIGLFKVSELKKHFFNHYLKTTNQVSSCLKLKSVFKSDEGAKKCFIFNIKSVFFISKLFH